jgi:phosphatidylinositol glycan class A protein
LSPLCHEGIFHARTMGLKTCFTDHSLFGFNDLGNVVGNKALKFTLSDVDHVICVSHTRYVCLLDDTRYKLIVEWLGN